MIVGGLSYFRRKIPPESHLHHTIFFSGWFGTELFEFHMKSSFVYLLCIFHNPFCMLISNKFFEICIALPQNKHEQRLCQVIKLDIAKD